MTSVVGSLLRSRTLWLTLGLACAGMVLLWASQDQSTDREGRDTRDRSHERDRQVQLGRPPGAPAPGGPIVKDGDVVVGNLRIELGAGCSVEVVDAASSRPVVGATVFVSFVPFEGGPSSKVELYTNETADGKGIATFRKLPRGAVVRFEIKSEGYLASRFRRPYDDVVGRQIKVRLAPALGTAESTCVIDVKSDDIAARDEMKIAVRVGAAGVIQIVRPGDRVLVSRDPSAHGDVEAKISVMHAGYATPWRSIALRRGGKVTAPFELKPARVTLRLDPQGGDISSPVKLSIVPHGVGGLAHHGTLRVVTDPSGRVTFGTIVGAKFEVQVEDGPAWIPPRLPAIEVREAEQRALIPAFRLVPARIVATSDVPRAGKGLTIAWHEFIPDKKLKNSLSALVGTSNAARALMRYPESLPAFVTIEDAGKPITSTLHLLPGSYVVSGRTNTAASLPVSVDVSGRDAVIDLLLAQTSPHKYEVVAERGADDASPIPPLVLAAVIGHRSGWQERFAIHQWMGRLWQDKATVAVKYDQAAMMVRTTRSHYFSLQRSHGRLPHDVGFLDDQGRVTLAAAGDPTELTIMWPGGLMAIVPIKAGQVRVQVRPEHLAALVVEVFESSGKPAVDFKLWLIGVDSLERGELQLGRMWKTDSHGRFRLGMLPGERAGIYSPTESSLVVQNAKGETIPPTVDGATGRNAYTPVTMPSFGMRAVSVHKQGSGK